MDESNCSHATIAEHRGWKAWALQNAAMVELPTSITRCALRIANYAQNATHTEKR